jgi:hypothetical protein
MPIRFSSDKQICSVAEMRDACPATDSGIASCPMVEELVMYQFSRSKVERGFQPA